MVRRTEVLQGLLRMMKFVSVLEIVANTYDPNSQVDNCVPRTVAPFRMARYPVTIAQFRPFLDECHRDDGWHLPPSATG